MGNVIISPNIKKESVRIDTNGNLIDPKTKQIVKPVEAEYVAPIPVTVSPELEKIIGTQTIQERLNTAKQLVVDLELAKKAEIQRMKDELAQLEAQ